MAHMKALSNTTLDAKLPVTWSQVLHNSLKRITPKKFLRTFGFWDNLPRVTQMKPNTQMSKNDCDPSPKPDFHKLYCGIVGSLGSRVTMTP